MSRNVPKLLLSCALAMFAMMAILFPLTHAGPQAVAPPPAEEPLAVVDSMLVDGAKSLDAAVDVATVTHNSEEEPVWAGMLLYVGDEIKTGPRAQLTVLFLDHSTDRHNEVLVDSNTRIQLGSIFGWLGRILVTVKGAFETKTEKSQVGVAGTAFELAVLPDGTNTIKVLEGEVTVEKGRFSPTTVERVPDMESAHERVVPFVNAAFAEDERVSQQGAIPFVAYSGTELTTETELELPNSCRREHLFHITGPDNLEWFQFLGDDQVEIAGNSSRKIRFRIKLDATHVPVGVYKGQIFAPCLDCAQEPACAIGGLHLDIVVNVLALPDTTPTASPSPTPEPERTASPNPPRPNPDTAGKLQEITLRPNGQLLKSRASLDAVDKTLAWSNEVVLAGQPSYSAESVAPHFVSAQER